MDFLAARSATLLVSGDDTGAVSSLGLDLNVHLSAVDERIVYR